MVYKEFYNPLYGIIIPYKNNNIKNSNNKYFNKQRNIGTIQTKLNYLPLKPTISNPKISNNNIKRK